MMIVESTCWFADVGLLGVGVRGPAASWPRAAEVVTLLRPDNRVAVTATVARVDVLGDDFSPTGIMIWFRGFSAKVEFRDWTVFSWPPDLVR
jgi:hypothetical protein